MDAMREALKGALGVLREGRVRRAAAEYGGDYVIEELSALLALPSTGDAGAGQHHHHCSCGDEFPTMVGYLEHRAMVHDEDDAVAAASAQAVEEPRGDDQCQQGDHYDVDGKCTACGRPAPAASQQPAYTGEIRAVLKELEQAASLFGGRVEERNPEWIREEEDSTDFANANHRLMRAIFTARKALATAGEAEHEDE
jgi:hypothetical protein